MKYLAELLEYVWCHQEMKLAFLIAIFLLETLCAEDQMSLLQENPPDVELDFNTMAHFGIAFRFNCENGSRMSIGDEKYISLGRIKKGKKASSKICKVKEVNSNELRIIKIMDNDVSSKEEAQIQLSLHDVPHVATLCSWDVLDKSRVIVMEYVESADWPKTNLRNIWSKLLKAVSAIHQKGILHLDLHLGNIILNKNDKIRILDFGQSVHIQAVNFTTICINKPKHPVTYASPEYLLKCKVEKVQQSWPRQSPNLRDDLLKNKMKNFELVEKILEEYDLRYKIGPPADVWSMCNALYQLMYGRLPYDFLLYESYAGIQLELNSLDATHVEKVQILMDKKSQFIFPPYPDDEVLRDTVIRCLVQEPNRRPTIQEMLDMLANKPPVQSNLVIKTNGATKDEL